MTIDKNGGVNIKNEMFNINKTDVTLLINKKISFFYDVIQKTIIHVQKSKSLDILGIADLALCVEKLNEVSVKIKTIFNNIKKNTDADAIINELQTINNEDDNTINNE